MGKKVNASMQLVYTETTNQLKSQLAERGECKEEELNAARAPLIDEINRLSEALVEATEKMEMMMQGESTRQAEDAKSLCLLTQDVQDLTMQLEQKDHELQIALQQLQESGSARAQLLNQLNETEEKSAALSLEHSKAVDQLKERNGDLYSDSSFDAVLRENIILREKIEQIQAAINNIEEEKCVIDKSYREIALEHSGCADALLKAQMETAALLAEIGERELRERVENIDGDGDYHEKLRSMSDEINVLKEKLVQAKKDYAVAEDKLLDAERTGRIQANLFESQKNDASFAVSSSQKIVSYENTIDTLSSEVIKLRESKEEIVSKLLLSQIDAKSKKEKIDELQATISKLTTPASKHQESEESQQQKLQDWIEELEDRLASREVEIDQLAQQLKQYQNNYEPLGEKLITLSHQLAVKDEENHEVHVKLENVEEEHRRALEDLRCVEVENRKLKERYDQVKEDYKSVSNKYRTAKKKLHVIETLAEKSNERTEELQETMLSGSSSSLTPEQLSPNKLLPSHPTFSQCSSPATPTEETAEERVSTPSKKSIGK